MNNNSKKRAPNFTPGEEKLLVQRVKKYRHILECKTTDAVSNKKKAACWEIVEKEFNCESGALKRSALILKKKYENLKKNIKKKNADQKCYKMGTGGGPFKDFPDDDIDVDLKDILGNRLDGFETEFGGDATNVMHEIEIGANEEIESEEVVNEESNSGSLNLECIDSENLNAACSSNTACSNNAICSNTSTHNGTQNKSGKGKKKNTGISKKVEDWLEVKSNVEKNKLTESGAILSLKLQLMREKHNEEIKLMRERQEEELKLMMEEHKIKMGILLNKD